MIQSGFDKSGIICYTIVHTIIYVCVFVKFVLFYCCLFYNGIGGVGEATLCEVGVYSHARHIIRVKTHFPFFQNVWIYRGRD